jgi:signal transduction histidine kinase/ActR/RegA family two-component response regulator
MELSETSNTSQHRPKTYEEPNFQDGGVPLSMIIVTDKLASRPSRTPDYRAENEALVSLAATLADHSGDILHQLAEHARLLCKAHSAGISLAESENGIAIFRWYAISGRLAPFVNGTMPRFFSPCGEVVDRGTPQLMQRPIRHYPYISQLGIDLHEALLVPFFRGREIIGTVWVVAHDADKTFDREDLRCIQNLCKFASAAVGMLENIKVLQDTSHRLQEKTEQLAEAAKRKDEFLATLSHELRSPLNIIQGHTELLRMETPGTLEFEESLDAIERSAKIQTQLISDMLDVSRIITGKMMLDITVFDPREIIIDAMRAIQYAADAKSIKLFYEIDATCGKVNGDRGRIQQALWNFLANAVKFSHPGGQVITQVRHRNGFMEFHVIDSGQGISSEFLPHVFERFNQEDGSKSRKYGGLGLGLAIVRHIAEIHGGTVRASSPGKNQGSTFSLFIPVVAVVDNLQAAPSKNDQAGLASPNPSGLHLAACKILVVDDQSEASSLLKRSLEILGATVQTTGSAEGAWVQLELNHYDILISDIGMPEVNGFDLIKTWRSKERMLGRKPLPAIALTAYGTREDQAEILAAGFTAHLSKPAELRELANIIVQEIQNHPPEL